MSYFVDGREELAHIHPDDYNAIASAAIAQGISVGAYIGGAGGIDGALKQAYRDAEA